MTESKTRKLYRKGLRVVTVYFNGGEDSGGISEIQYDTPENFVISQMEEDDLETMTYEIIEKFWRTFDSTPMVTGQVVLELKKDGDIEFEFENFIDIGYEAGRRSITGEDGVIELTHKYGGKKGYKKHEVHKGILDNDGVHETK